MKLYLVIVLVLCGSYADDELPEDIADLLSQFSDDFNHQLQKRLTDLDPDLNLLDQAQKVDKGKLVNDKGSSCFYEVSEQRIIRTHDSLNNGATYIDSPTEIQNQTACRAECCTHSECDLAVFKDKGDEHACYLFACNGACLFTNHTGFTTMEKRRMAQQHEADLANLATDPPSTTVSEATTTTTTESTTSPTPTTVRTNKAPLFGSCIEDSDCGEIRTECLAGYCVCQQGSHAQGGVCREECSRFQFECANEGKPLSYPQCIAIYDTCDGIPHCRDGSDELKCDPRSSSSSDAKTVLTGGGVLQDSQGFNDRQQLQPWQQQFLQQQQQQQLLKAGYIPQMLGQQQPQQSLYNVGQQSPSLPGYVPQLGVQQIPQQVPHQVLLPVQGQNPIQAQVQVPAQIPMQINQQLAQGNIPVQNPSQRFLTSQGIGSDQDLNLLQQHLGLQGQQMLPESTQQQQTNIQIQPLTQPEPQQTQQQQQQRQQNQKQQQQQQQQIPPSQSGRQVQKNVLPQGSVVQQIPSQTSVGIPQITKPVPPVQSQIQNIPLPQNNLKQVELHDQNQQGSPDALIRAQQTQVATKIETKQQENPYFNTQQQQQVINQPVGNGGREVDFPAGHHLADNVPDTKPPLVPVHADHMNRHPITDDHRPLQRQPTTVMPPQIQRGDNRGNKTNWNPVQQQQPPQQQEPKDINLNSQNNDFITNAGLVIPNSGGPRSRHRQQNGMEINQQVRPNQMKGHPKKPVGQISYTDGGAVVADSRPPVSHPNNGAGRKVQNPGSPASQAHNLPLDAAQGRQGDYGRGNWRNRIDPYLNSKVGYPTDQYGSKPNSHRGYSGDRYGSYNYETNPFPQGYPSNDQFYAYYDTDTPGSNTRTDYDYQYAADPSVGVDASFDELASLVEELLEDAEKGRVISQGGASTDSGDAESNRDGAFWDYYDSSSYVPPNGQKTSGDGTSSAGRNRGHQPGNNTPIKGMNLRPQGRYQRPNQPYQNSGNSHVRVGPVRKNPQLPDTSKAETSAGQDRTIVTRPKGPPSNLKNKIPSHPEAPSPTLSSKSDTPQDEAKDNAPLIPKDVPVKEAPAQVAPKASATSAPSVETSPDPVTTVKDTTNKKPPHSGGGTGEMAKHVAPLEHVLNDAEKEPSVKASNKTAVVVLAMGLAVTALLLIFVGCRLRMVKRRLRRGRPLNSNEADYLINGMYL